MIRGIDVSAVQGDLDWDAIAAWGAQFAIAKCCEGNVGKDPIFDLPGFYVDHARSSGTSGQDPNFQRNIDGARKAGLVVGGYGFAYPLPPKPGSMNHDPEDQAKFHFDLSGGLGSIDGDLPWAFDFEWPEPDAWVKWGCSAIQLRTWALAYLEAATDYWGCPPIVYTYPDFWMHVGGGSEPGFSKYPLWMASYTHDQKDWPKDGDRPLVVRPWTQASVWQFSGGGIRLPNGTPVDGDVIADEETLHTLTHS